MYVVEPRAQQSTAQHSAIPLHKAANQVRADQSTYKKKSMCVRTCMLHPVCFPGSVELLAFPSRLFAPKMLYHLLYDIRHSNPVLRASKRNGRYRPLCTSNSNATHFIFGKNIIFRTPLWGYPCVQPVCFMSYRVPHSIPSRWNQPKSFQAQLPSRPNQPTVGPSQATASKHCSLDSVQVRVRVRVGWYLRINLYKTKRGVPICYRPYGGPKMLPIFGIMMTVMNRGKCVPTNHRP